MRLSQRAAILVTILLATPLYAADAPGTLFRNVRIFDGTRVLEENSLLIEDRKIAEIGKDLEAPKGAEVIDGSGHTVLPGLIDSHTHVISAEMLEKALAFGVTTELDMFMSHSLAQKIKSQQTAGQARHLADLRSAGTLVTAPGGHGSEYGIPIPTIKGPEEAEEFVTARIQEGSDYIKVVYDDGTPHGLNWPTISKETLSAVVQAAHKHDKLAVVHIGTLEAAREAIEAGADGIVHLFSDGAYDPEFGKFVAEHDAFVIPTLTVIESVTGKASGESLTHDPRIELFLSPQDTAGLSSSFPGAKQGKKSFEAAQKTIPQLRQAGVPILAGTDAPNPGTIHGASIHRELALLVAAGLTAKEALTAATATPAKLFNLKDRGRIEPGVRADLLLVKGDPTTRIEDTRDIAGVWKQGHRFDRKRYAREISSEQRAYERQLEAEPPDGFGSGLVSDFEQQRVDSNFGFGWQISTDTMMGGQSRAEMSLAEGGAQDSRQSLKITGTVVEGAPRPWAGAMFFPGSYPMSAANLSSKSRISFFAKGDGKQYQVLVFARSFGMLPAVRSFTAESEWKKYTFTWSQFNGCDGRDVTALFFGASAPGPFTLQVDDIRLEP